MRYEIRAMSFAEILDTGFRILRDHFALLVGIACVLYVPIGLLTSWFVPRPTGAEVPHLGLAIAGGFVLILVVLALGPLVFAAITFAVGEVYVGKSVTVGQSLRVAFSIMLPYGGTALLYALAMLGVVFLPLLGAIVIRTGSTPLGVALVVAAVPCGVYLFLSFLLVWQVMVLERIYGLAALKRSRRLMRGNLLRGAGVTLVGAIVVGVLGGILQLALGFIPFVGSIGVAVARAVGVAYTTAVAVLLYFDIRCRSEAFDLEHLAQVVAAHEAPAVAPPVPGGG